MTNTEIQEIIKKEGKYKEFEAFGLKCIIKRMSDSMIHLCGYVQVPKGSILEEKDYYYFCSDECNLTEIAESINKIQVHGGLTFAGTLKSLKHCKGEGYCFGFDCAHSNDLCNLEPGSIMNTGTYRNMDYVIKECSELAEQLLKIHEIYTIKESK